MNTTSTRLYERDFYGWIQNQADMLRSGNFASLDLENLIEEIEDMGKRQKQELRSRLSVLFAHLLKWQYQPTLQSNSWVATIKVQRFEIMEHLDENPSLKHDLDETIIKAWRRALMMAETETGILASKFPACCPWTFEQVMDENFWPQVPAPTPAPA